MQSQVYYSVYSSLGSVGKLQGDDGVLEAGWHHYKRAPSLMQLLSRKVCNMLCKPRLRIKGKDQPMQPRKQQKKKRSQQHNEMCHEQIMMHGHPHCHVVFREPHIYKIMFLTSRALSYFRCTTCAVTPLSRTTSTMAGDWLRTLLRMVCGSLVVYLVLSNTRV